ncbi:MAG: 30S ribosome-binding factor RbfA [Oscillospiraceae bacterium]|nr:30S ribosome-binding factor RbfA [Oscillospiraceae bacterium]
MASFKVGRLAEDIKRELTAIIRELKDPRIAEFLTVVRVDLSNDLSHCKVYISSFGGIEKAQQSVKGLESASGFIKRELFSRLKMRKCPDLKFIADNSIERSSEINKIIDNFK